MGEKTIVELEKIVDHSARRVDLSGRIIADQQKKLDVFEKLFTAQGASIGELNKQIVKVGQDIHSLEKVMPHRSIIEKAEKLVHRVSHLEEITEKVRQNVGIVADLAKPVAQMKIAFARMEALASQVEALKKDMVTTADLKALEKRILDQIKKAK